jgi:mRNA-degrading endonuclease RelE of RelBE toxin-antitoxin system
MRFIETPVFTKAIDDLLEADEYLALQSALLVRPNMGPVIPGVVGLRKARWSRPGSGKRGGIRIIYHWDIVTDTFYLLYAYPKSSRENLTMSQLRILSKLVREEFQ